jgi:nucleotide-binding universal stress UspA family protein
MTTSTSPWCRSFASITSIEQAQAKVVEREFTQRCQAKGVPSKWRVEQGDAAYVICDRARWMDLIVLCQGAHCARWPERAMDPALRTVLQRAARPVLAALEGCSAPAQALLAYDGSPHAREALYVAAHVASQWGLPLSVVTVEEKHRASRETLDEALQYLSARGVSMHALLRHGQPSEAILRTADELHADWLILGAGGYSPFGEWFVRTTLERVLREATCPVVVCR